MIYKRILLKLSGESLAGDLKQGLNSDILNSYAEQIKSITQLGVQVGIVIGGGNIFRGLSGQGKGYDRVKGDQMGMLATIINSLALQTMLENINVSTKLFTSFKIESIGNRFAKSEVISALENSQVCIFAGGTGNPYFSTDTTAALRAVEIEADILLKGTRVDGVYNKDPEKHQDAVKFEKITFDEVYNNNLKIMDLTSFTLCKENKMNLIVFDMDTYGNLEKIIKGDNIGTIVYN